MKTLAVTLLAALALLAASATATATPALNCSVTIFVNGGAYTGHVNRSVNTSCPFARRVTAASLRFIVLHGGDGDGDFYVSVYSTVTLKTYRMHCFAFGSLGLGLGVHVDCRGGLNARVVYTAHRS